ncbi:MAG: HAD hydrolase family protein, partial [Bacilli bacterium]
LASLNELTNNFKFDGYVLQTGALLIKDQQVLLEKNISNEVVLAIISDYEAIKDIEFAFDTIKTAYTYNGIRYGAYNIPLVSLDLKAFKEHVNDVIQMCIVALDEEQALLIKDEILAKYPNQVSVYCNTNFVDIMAPKTSKATGIAYFVQHDQLNLNDIIVIGDGGNDLSMFKYIKKSYSFNHASPLVQSKASMIVESFDDIIRKEIN